MAKQKDDHLLNYIKDNEQSAPQQIIPENIQQFGDNIRMKVDKIEINGDWNNIPLTDLPYGKFYPIGTQLFIRPASTKEIEAFSVVNDANVIDVQLKLNEVLSACTRIEFIDGKIGSYRDIQNGDRDTLSIMIARISKKHGSKIERETYCDCNIHNKEAIKIDMVPANYVFKTENPKLTKWFNNQTKKYEFRLKNGVEIAIAPPTIGMQEDMIKYVFYQATKSEGKVTPPVTFIEMIPYLKSGKGVKSLSLEELEQEEFNFSKMDEELFMFADDAIKLISFSVDELKTTCKNCEKELKTEFKFPSGARALFVIPNAFDEFIG